MKKNLWQMLDSYLCMQDDLEKDNGHSLVLVLRKRGTLSRECLFVNRRKQQTSRPDHLWPEIWKTMGRNAKAEGEAKVVQ